MSFFRSQTMGYYNLIVPRESAWTVMNELADLDNVHFVDYDPLTALINRPFANYIKRCDDVLSKISVFDSEVSRYKKKITYCPDVRALSLYYKQVLKSRNKAPHTYFDELEQEIDQRSHSLIEQTKNLETLYERRNQLIENRAVLLKGQQILGMGFFQQRNYQGDGSNIDVHGKKLEEIRGLSSSVRFNQFVGVIPKADQNRFKRILFRITKGNVWVNMVDIDEDVLFGNEQIVDPRDQKPVLKTVFVIVFPGGGVTNLIQNKVNKVVDTFGASKYEFPDSVQKYEKLLSEIDQNLTETKNLISLTRNQIESTVDEFARVQGECNCSYVEELKLYIIREKYLYVHMNYLRMQGSIFCGSLWVPQGQESEVEKALRQVQQNYENLPSGQLQATRPDSDQTPPTYFKTNEFTMGFQEIVNTYGIPRYKEVNPGLFTCFTFPFLFGVMFGDIGHGFVLMMTGLYMTLYNQQLKKSDSAFKILLPVRHMILLMGACAFYNGWIYNDFISISIDLFGSCYKLEEQTIKNRDNTTTTEEIWVQKPNCTYPVGIDPVWSVSSNELSFVNSYKMKLSVIIAVIQMTFGILLKGANSIYFRNWLDLIFEFIPQIIFFIATFGLMDFLIIYKWLHAYVPTSSAPSIITVMINMALQPTQPVDPPVFVPNGGVQEQQLQLTLLTIAMICVPIMLLPKPLILMMSHKDHSEQKNSSGFKPLLGANDNEYNIQIDEKSFELENNQLNTVSSAKKNNEHDSSEIFVHQVIETIEFVLGSISNTASYLRLWALSLAHGQLSEVFFGMTLAGSINKGGFGGFIGLVFYYPIFSLATFGVLMLMDVMECFLHALRLHWVEFQNKFYKADGYLFVPYSFYKALHEAAQPPAE